MYIYIDIYMYLCIYVCACVCILTHIDMLTLCYDVCIYKYIYIYR